jgi:hypothetical protein
MDVIADAVLVKQLIELLVINAMRALHLSIQAWRAGRMYTCRMSSVSRCQWNWD